MHVAIDDHSRLAYAEVLGDERASTAVGFLRRALGFFARRGIRVERVMTDDGSAYRAHQHGLACQRLGLKHLFTRPYRPRTNGKAERFIQTLTGEWAEGRLYANSAERTSTLDAWLDHYNYTRPHGSLAHKPPGSRLTRAPEAAPRRTRARGPRAPRSREPAPGLDRVGVGLADDLLVAGALDLPMPTSASLSARCAAPTAAPPHRRACSSRARRQTPARR